jgi:hypothetical protein
MSPHRPRDRFCCSGIPPIRSRSRLSRLALLGGAPWFVKREVSSRPDRTLACRAKRSHEAWTLGWRSAPQCICTLRHRSRGKTVSHLAIYEIEPLRGRFAFFRGAHRRMTGPRKLVRCAPTQFPKLGYWARGPALPTLGGSSSRSSVKEWAGTVNSADDRAVGPKE